MTPMQITSQHFKTLDSFILKESFYKNELVKKAPKYKYGTCDFTKGVESDFIRFYTERANKAFSIGFSFNNYNQDVKKTEVSISIKKNKNFESVHIGLEEFKEKMNALNKILSVLEKTKALSPEAIVNTIKSVFAFSKEYEKPNLKSVLSNLEKTLKSDLEALEIEESQIKLNIDELKKSNIEIEKKVSEYKKKLLKSPKRVKLGKEIVISEDIIKKLKEKIQETYNKTISAEIEKHRNVRPSEIRKEISDLLKDSKGKLKLIAKD